MTSRIGLPPAGPFRSGLAVSASRIRHHLPRRAIIPLAKHPRYPESNQVTP